MMLSFRPLTRPADWQPFPTRALESTDNPSTLAKVELGKMLFYDPRLSSTGTLSCFCCHNFMEDDDHHPNSIGVHDLIGGRNAPRVWNPAFLSVQFWDGRAPTLEVQAKGPIANRSAACRHSPIPDALPVTLVPISAVRRCQWEPAIS